MKTLQRYRSVSSIWFFLSQPRLYATTLKLYKKKLCVHQLPCWRILFLVSPPKVKNTLKLRFSFSSTTLPVPIRGVVRADPVVCICVFDLAQILCPSWHNSLIQLLVPILRWHSLKLTLLSKYFNVEDNCVRTSCIDDLSSLTAEFSQRRMRTTTSVVYRDPPFSLASFGLHNFQSC